jgi:uncharacterized protein YwqG
MRIPIPPDLAELEDRIIDAVAPCIVLSPATGDEPRTRLGGDPLVPRGAVWPHVEGRPLAFLGQLDFAELAQANGPALGLPSRGVLALFYDVDAYVDGSAPEHRPHWQLVWSPDPEHCEVAKAPDALRSPAEPLVADEAISVPSRADLTLSRWHPSPTRAPWYEAYADFSERLALSQGRMPPLAGLQQQVGGYGDWSQRDARIIAQLASQGRSVPPNAGTLSSLPPPEAVASASRWKLLWQLRLLADPATWIDRGTLYVLIRDHDLAQCAFHRAWVVLLAA